MEVTMATPVAERNNPNANHGREARDELWNDTMGRQSDKADKPYSAHDDPAVNKGNLGASVPSTEASRLALLIAEGCQLTPAMFAIMCEDPYPETLVTEGFDWNCGLEPVSKLHEMLLAERESVDRMAVQLVMRKRASGYYSELINPPYFEPLPSRLPQSLQSASDVKPVYLPAGDFEKANEEALKAARPNKEVKLHDKLAAAADRETDLDKAAEAKWKVKPAKIDELFEAIQFAIAHPHKPEAQELTDGFVIIKNAHCWKLEHPAIGRLPVIATRLDEKQPLRDVVRRQDVRDCLVALRESVEAKREQRSGPVLIKKAVEEFAANVTPVRETVAVAALDPHKFYHRATMHPAPIMLDKKGL
jgi:hypothetical protein